MQLQEKHHRLSSSCAVWAARAVLLCSSLTGQLLKGSLLCYQRVVSPLLGPTCRFYPSCSQYALEAVGKYGAAKGTGFALRRLAKCHPWHPGGVDLLP